MNVVRERILLDVGLSLKNYSLSEYRDLISISVCSEYFSDYEDENEGIEADFDEVIAIIDKEWLFNYMQRVDQVDNPRMYLINEYTSDDSSNWFDEANRANMIAMIAFN